MLIAAATEHNISCHCRAFHLPWQRPSPAPFLGAAVFSLFLSQLVLSPVLFDPATFFRPAQHDNVDREDIVLYLDALRERGLIVVQLPQIDTSAAVLKHIVAAIGDADAHDDKGTIFWDVKYDTTVDQTTAARSLTTNAFPLHTDASFEDPQPQYVAFYVIKEDKLGGGITQIIDARNLLPLLPAKTFSVLQNSSFKIRVPDEFRKNKLADNESFIEKPIIDEVGNIRYRREIIVHEDLLLEQIKALDQLDWHLQNNDLQESILLPAGAILIFDNGRFLHARTQVLDKSRHLIRMRFNGRTNETAHTTENSTISSAIR